MSQFPLEVWMGVTAHMGVRTIHAITSTCRGMHSLLARFLQERFTASNSHFETVFTIEGSPHVFSVARSARTKGLSFDLPILLSILNHRPSVTLSLLEACGTQGLEERTLHAAVTFAAERRNTVLLSDLCAALSVYQDYDLALSRPLAWAAETGDATMAYFLLHRGARVTADVVRAARISGSTSCIDLFLTWNHPSSLGEVY